LLSVYLSGRRPPFESTSSPARARAHFQTFCRNRERVQCVPQALFLSGNARLFSGPKSRSYSSARISSRPFFSSFFSSFDASLMAISFSSRLLGLAAGATSSTVTAFGRRVARCFFTDLLFLRFRVCRRVGEGVGADCCSTGTRGF